MVSSRQSTDTSDREIVVTRVFDAPRELVWRAWTEPEHLIKWWGPRGFTNTFHEIDVRPGGVWLFTMHGPDGVNYANKVVFKEVVPPERITYSHGGGDDDEFAVFQSEVTFEDVGGKTRLTMQAVFESPEILKQMIEEVGAVEGANQTLDRLGEYLARM